MRHAKTRKRPAPEEIKRLKRDLGLDKQFMGPLRSFIRLQKDADQLLGSGAIGVPTEIWWSTAPYDIGDAVDAEDLVANRMKIPKRMGGMWSFRVVLNLDGATVVPESQYQVELYVNGSRHSWEANQTSCRRQATARFQEELEVVVDDLITVRLTNNPSTGLNNDNGTKNINVLAGSYFTASFLGKIEEIL